MNVFVDVRPVWEIGKDVFFSFGKRHRLILFLAFQSGVRGITSIIDPVRLITSHSATTSTVFSGRKQLGEGSGRGVGDICWSDAAVLTRCWVESGVQLVSSFYPCRTVRYSAKEKGREMISWRSHTIFPMKTGCSERNKERAGGGARTHTILRSLDFEPSALEHARASAGLNPRL